MNTLKIPSSAKITHTHDQCCPQDDCLCRHRAMTALNILKKTPASHTIEKTPHCRQKPAKSSALLLTFRAPLRFELLRWCFWPVGRALSYPRTSFRWRHARIAYVEALPRSVTWIQAKGSFRSEDDPILQFAPYFGDDDVGSKDLLCGYETSLRMKGMEHPCPALARQRVAERDRLIKAAGGPSPELAKLLGVDELDSHFQLGNDPPLKIAVGITNQKEVDDSTYQSYADDVDCYRALLCRRCWIFDCNAHGIVPAAPPRALPVISAPHFTEKLLTKSATTTLKLWPQVAEPLDDRRRRLAERALAVFTGCAARAARALQVDIIELCSFLGLDLPTWPCCERCRDADCAPAEQYAAAPLYQKRRRRHPERKYASRDIETNATWCLHEGPCSLSANCECLRKDTFCGKLCGCFERSPCGPPRSQSCANQFAGCECRSGKCDRRSCPCFAAGRECDPDLCDLCGASSDALFGGKRCSNDQLGCRAKLPKLAIAKSDIPGAGWGLFAPHGARKGQLLVEYVGERISQQEAERRGRVYDKLNRSYLFNANDEEVVDATRFGNKARFANHSNKPNCITRAKHVNGVTRLGIYANSDVPPHAELSFDYRYLVPAKSEAQVKHAILVDWMVDHKMANVVSKTKGTTVLQAPTMPTDCSSRRSSSSGRKRRRRRAS